MEFDTIAGIASGMGGGIGIIRISGPEALKAAGAIFRTKKYLKDPKKEWNQAYFEKKETHTIHYGMIVNEDGSMLDEVMVLLMKAPRSYTCEDVVEIDSHGGPFLVQKILKRILHQGVRLAEPGEFTKRAFLNGRIDLAQAEAVMKMISSKGEFALESATKQLEGRVSGYIEEIRQEILHNMGYIEAALDDPEHYELDGFSEKLYDILQKECNRLHELLDNFENGRMKSEGINTVIVGKPNAGKSSLMNLLLDEERAIVTDIAGTTRDTLEESVTIDGITLNIVDTAGIRDTEDKVESIGVERAKKEIESADLILFLMDTSVQISEEDIEILQRIRDKKKIILLNKSDKATEESGFEQSALKEYISEETPVISISAKYGDGIDNFIMELKNMMFHGRIDVNQEVYITNARHKDALAKTYESLECVERSIEAGMPEDFFTIDLMNAYEKLGLIIGESVEEDLVNEIFSKFCTGK